MLLGLDVGTSATKAVLVREDGTVIASASASHPIARPRDGWSEQCPDDWWRSTRESIAGVLRAAGPGAPRVRAVGLSGQMHGSVFVSREAMGGAPRDGAVLRPALLWNDQRTASQCEAIERIAGGRAALVHAVGNAALTGFTAPKLLWLREHEPELHRRLGALLLPKDFIRWRLTGTIGTDVGDASGTLLFDPSARRWHEGLIAALGIDASILPDAVESAVVVGVVSGEAASATGLPAGVPVVAGTGDNQAGAVGAGVVEPGQVLMVLGTSGVVYAHSDAPRPDLVDVASPGRTHSLAAADGDARRTGQWCVTGVMLSAAGSLQWFRDALAPGVGFDELMAQAWSSPPGCEGLVFLPYLSGERCPHADPLARGAFVGLTARHTRAHLARAVVEGVSFAMAQIFDLVRGLGVRASGVRAVGGGAKSREWRSLLATLTGVPVSVPAIEEGGASGAALLAAVGAGVYPSVREACAACVKPADVERPTTPDPRLTRARAVFEGLYADLSPANRALGTEPN